MTYIFIFQSSVHLLVKNLLADASTEYHTTQDSMEAHKRLKENKHFNSYCP